MKNNVKIVGIAIAALAIGLFGGYLIYGNAKPDEMLHNHEMGADGSEAVQEIWTCSMHPQIRQNEPGQCPICGMDLIPLSAASSGNPLVLEMTEEAAKLANIQTTVIGRGAASGGKTIRLTGKVQVDERSASSQVSHVPGRIEKLFVSFTGERVYKGQKVARLYSPELITAQRELIEAVKLKSAGSGLLEAARNKLRYWRISESLITQVEQEGKVQETFDILADASGIVTKRRVSVGDYVKQGESLFDLMNLNRLWILFDAYESDLPAVSVGDRIDFTTPSLQTGLSRTRVTFIDPLINPNTRVASVRAEIDNTRGQLKPEMLVYGELQNRAGKSVKLTVPKSAVMWTGKRSVVYVRVPEASVPSFEFREVEIGESLGDTYQVLKGLEPGDEVVTNGNFSIDAAAQLNNQASMMNRNVSVRKKGTVDQLPDYTETTPEAFKQQIFDLAKSYLNLKNALVASDDKQAREAASQLRVALKKVDMAMLKGEAHRFWMDQHEAITAHSEKISGTDDLEAQRKQFDYLSQAVIKTAKSFGIGKETLYVQHCPMANDNKGADWLSDEEEIRNPYFGDEMLTCGVVKTTIDAAFRNPGNSK